MAHENNHKKTALFGLALGALGVVYGDIGTSPLYAIREIFFGHALHGHIETADVYGAISIVFWALTLIVTLKYIVLVLRADADGEGGVFALYSLISEHAPKALWMLPPIVFAAGLLFGDGIITPAISVVSAVEGLNVITPFFQPYVVLITIVILTALFAIQSKGTAKIGAFFGPVMLVWFAVIGVLGFSSITHNPQILQAVNPLYAIHFFATHNIHTIFLILGSVMLVVTGGEAMYADMGHFGRSPIRLSWLILAYPALLLNYFGQGAYLLSGKEVVAENLFFSMAPHWALIPVVILATMATVIASQALISGAFSLTMQAIQLRLFPYLSTKHTHHEHEGQIYIGLINWALYAGAVALVILFQTSARLASAYGLAVSGVMLVTTMGMIAVAQNLWKWKKLAALALFVPFALIDGTFLVANSLKLFEGGYIPLAIALAIYGITRAWKWGRHHVRAAFLTSYQAMSVKELVAMKDQAKAALPRTIVLMTPDAIAKRADDVPVLKLMFIDRYGLLPEHLIFLTVKVLRVPYIHEDRVEAIQIYSDKKKGSITSVTVKFGFMEDTNVEAVLGDIAAKIKAPVADTKDWGIHVVHEHIRAGQLKRIQDKIKFLVFRFLLKNTESADHHFHLGQKHDLTIEALPVTIG